MSVPAPIHETKRYVDVLEQAEGQKKIDDNTEKGSMNNQKPQSQVIYDIFNKLLRALATNQAKFKGSVNLTKLKTQFGKLIIGLLDLKSEDQAINSENAKIFGEFLEYVIASRKDIENELLTLGLIDQNKSEENAFLVFFKFLLPIPTAGASLSAEQSYIKIAEAFKHVKKEKALEKEKLKKQQKTSSISAVAALNATASASVSRSASEVATDVVNLSSAAILKSGGAPAVNPAELTVDEKMLELLIALQELLMNRGLEQVSYDNAFIAAAKPHWAKLVNNFGSKTDTQTTGMASASLLAIVQQFKNSSNLTWLKPYIDPDFQTANASIGAVNLQGFAGSAGVAAAEQGPAPASLHQAVQASETQSKQLKSLIIKIASEGVNSNQEIDTLMQLIARLGRECELLNTETKKREEATSSNVTAAATTVSAAAPAPSVAQATKVAYGSGGAPVLTQFAAGNEACLPISTQTRHPFLIAAITAASTRSRDLNNNTARNRADEKHEAERAAAEAKADAENRRAAAIKAKVEQRINMKAAGEEHEKSLIKLRRVYEAFLSIADYDLKKLQGIFLDMNRVLVAACRNDSAMPEDSSIKKEDVRRYLESEATKFQAYIPERFKPNISHVVQTAVKGFKTQQDHGQGMRITGTGGAIKRMSDYFGQGINDGSSTEVELNIWSDEALLRMFSKNKTIMTALKNHRQETYQDLIQNRRLIDAKMFVTKNDNTASIVLEDVPENSKGIFTFTFLADRLVQEKIKQMGVLFDMHENVRKPLERSAAKEILLTFGEMFDIVDLQQICRLWDLSLTETLLSQLLMFSKRNQPHYALRLLQQSILAGLYHPEEAVMLGAFCCPEFKLSREQLTLLKDFVLTQTDLQSNRFIPELMRQ